MLIEVISHFNGTFIAVVELLWLNMAQKGKDNKVTETLPSGGEAFCSSGTAACFGASGVGFFSIVGSLNKRMPLSQKKL